MPFHERQTSSNLVRGRIAVPGRPPEDDVRDVEFFPVAADGFEHPVKQLAAGSDERQALPVLLGPRRLADEHQPRLRIAIGENRICGRLLEATILKALNRRLELGNRIGLCRQGPRCLNRLTHPAAIRRCGGFAGSRPGTVPRDARGGRRTLLRRRLTRGLPGQGKPVDRGFPDGLVDPGLKVEPEDFGGGWIGHVTMIAKPRRRATPQLDGRRVI